MKCPSCGADKQTGRFCAECGAGLDVSCPSCGAGVPPGSRFCTSCGDSVAGGASEAGGSSGSRAGWLFAAAALVVVLLVLFLPRQADRVPAPPAGQSGAPLSAPGGMGGGSLGGLSSDMRTNADRLFNRIMMAAEQGNQAEVDQFMPMAIQAYQMVEDLNDDGVYHLATLQLTAGEYEEARATARQILENSPNHVLALGVAATAATESGDDAGARELWGQLLDGYSEEAGKPLPEYLDHQVMLTEYRRQAREATGRS